MIHRSRRIIAVLVLVAFGACFGLDGRMAHAGGGGGGGPIFGIVQPTPTPTALP